MGMDQSVTFTNCPIPAWETVSALLSTKAYPVQMRMIDGQLAFPDEMPASDWNEIRVGTPHGMITIRKEPNRLVFVTWGNADVEMQKAWNALTWAFAEAGSGSIQSGGKSLSAGQFVEKFLLPESFKMN
ncbi:MAG: hypothetical protein ACJ8FY_18155 [Gemmataceae bacterium]